MKKLSFLIIPLIFFFTSCKEKIPVPIPDFSFIVNKGEVMFMNQSKNADKYESGFGDGIGSSQLKDPSYIYNAPGQYLITLKATGVGGEAQIQRIIDVKAVRPVSAFSYTYLDNGDIQFKNESKDATTFVWFTNEQPKTNQKDPKIQFIYNGKYKVKLKAEGFGYFDESEQEIIITNGKPPIPIADFDIHHLGFGKYQFTNKSQNANSITWDFGDNRGKSNSENPEYTYQENGSYKIRFTATGKGGSNTKDSLLFVTSAYEYYPHTIENKSAYTIVAYNNNPTPPLYNFAEVIIPPSSKTIIKIRANTGLQPVFKSDDTNLQIEYLTSDNKNYSINAYYYYYEVRFTGTCEPITINTNIKGTKETLNNVKLPTTINAKFSNVEVLELEASKNNVNGILNIQVFIKNALIQTKSVADPFASISIKYNVSKKTI